MAENIQNIDLGYTPRVLQAKLHNELKRFSVVVAHRRMGKTVFSIMHMIAKGLSCNLKNPQYAYIAPTYGQAKRVAWEYLKDYTKEIPNRKVNEADLRVDIEFPIPDIRGKVRFLLLGADNPDSLRGIYLDGAVLDEYAQCDPILWGQVIRPALSDRKGWGIFIGTPKGQNHFYDIYNKMKGVEGWYNAVYPASETGIVEEAELVAARIEMSEEEYEQEFECSFSAALLGSYYGKYLNDLDREGHICNVPYDANVPVSTYWDLGISDTTAVWFVQEVGREIHLIDYIENAGVGLEWYVKELKKRGQGGHNYIYEDHWIPHDGAARELGTGVTRQETMRNFGLGTKIVPRQSIADGINASRLLLPRCWFDKVLTKRGFDALKNYQRKYDSKSKMFVDKPLHDWSSNGSDAFRMMAITLGGNSRSFGKQLPRAASSSYNPLA